MSGWGKGRLTGNQRCRRHESIQAAAGCPREPCGSDPRCTPRATSGRHLKGHERAAPIGESLVLLSWDGGTWRRLRQPRGGVDASQRITYDRDLTAMAQ